MADPTRLSRRSTAEVLQDHLAHRVKHDVQGDMQRNYHEDVVILTMEGCYRGREGVGRCYSRLHDLLGRAEFSFPVERVQDRYAFLEWRARSGRKRVEDGADTFVIENGQIVCQTIRYSLREAGSAEPDGQREPADAERSGRLHPEEDPAEGARDVVERQLEGKRSQ